MTRVLARVLFFLLTASMATFTPDTVQAQGFVQCSGPDCDFCDLVTMGETILRWLIQLAVIISTIILAVAGIRMVMARGNSGALNQAKDSLLNIVIGIFIVAIAFTFIDTLMKVLVGGSFGPWNEIETEGCGGSHRSGSSDFTVTANNNPVDALPSTEREIDILIQQDNLVGQGLPGGVEPQSAGSYGGVSGCSGGSCAALSTPCKNGCSVAPGLVNAINQFHNDAGVSGARVTEAMPPTRSHKSSCHSNGTCIDYSKAGGMTAAEVQSVIGAARKNGLRPVYEVASVTQKTELVNAGVDPSAILVLGSHISAPHFSIYAE